MTEFTRCPDCGKKGVHLVLRPRGEDNYHCRYCGFGFFTSGGSPIDTEREARWKESNEKTNQTGVTT